MGVWLKAVETIDGFVSRNGGTADKALEKIEKDTDIFKCFGALVPAFKAAQHKSVKKIIIEGPLNPYNAGMKFPHREQVGPILKEHVSKAQTENAIFAVKAMKKVKPDLTVCFQGGSFCEESQVEAITGGLGVEMGIFDHSVGAQAPQLGDQIKRRGSAVSDKAVRDAMAKKIE